MKYGADEIKCQLSGISGILVTPFSRDDEIEPSKLKPIVDRAIDAGVHMLVANGNTSEFYSLTMAEAERMVHAAVEHVSGRVPVLAGVGRGIHDACRLAQVSRGAGASALVIHQPPDPFVAPRGVVAYVQRIAEACSGLPVLLYLRDDGIGLDIIERLCELPSVIGVKWACPTPVRLNEAIRRASQDIVWVCGLAETWAPSLVAAGAKGFTSGLINVWPERSVAIHRALETEDYELARELIIAIEGFERLRSEERNGTNVSVIKTALQMIGQDCGRVRPPGAWPLTQGQEEKIRQEMAQWSNHANAPALAQ